MAKLQLPIIILGIAQPETEHRIGQRSALPIAGMNPDQHRPVVAALNIPRVELRGVHGVRRLEG